MRTCSGRAMCRILSLVVTLTRMPHKNDVDGRLSESRNSYELRKTSYRSRVLPRLVSFLLHPSFLRYKAILHIRLGHARASRCHPLVFSTDLLYSLSFSSSIHLTFSISFFVCPYYSQFS